MSKTDKKNLAIISGKSGSAKTDEKLCQKLIQKLAIMENVIGTYQPEHRQDHQSQFLFHQRVGEETWKYSNNMERATNNMAWLICKILVTCSREKHLTISFKNVYAVMGLVKIVYILWLIRSKFIPKIAYKFMKELWVCKQLWVGSKNLKYANLEDRVYHIYLTRKIFSLFNVETPVQAAVGWVKFDR